MATHNNSTGSQATTLQGAAPVHPSLPQVRPLRREGAVILFSAAEQALEEAMLRSSPEPDASDSLLGKRTRDATGNSQDGDETEPEDDGPPPIVEPAEPIPLGNIRAATLRYASQKRIRTDQRGELDAFLEDSALGRQARLYVCLLSIESKVDAFKSATPPYQVSEELKVNITNYAMAVLLSSKISAYKGDIPRNHILIILKRYRFDLPVGIEHDLSNWEKITSAVSYGLTQVRSKIKKAIRNSMATAPTLNIFALSQEIVAGTPCRVTVYMCARISLMRAIYVECSGHDKYWNHVDARLAHIRRVAGSDRAKTNRAFKKILDTDQATYGVGEDYEIGDTVSNEWQQTVDDVVAGISEHDDR